MEEREAYKEIIEKQRMDGSDIALSSRRHLGSGAVPHSHAGAGIKGGGEAVPTTTKQPFMFPIRRVVT
jgi:hypothetical protein